jgi:hypothetical protein
MVPMPQHRPVHHPHLHFPHANRGYLMHPSAATALPQQHPPPIPPPSKSAPVAAVAPDENAATTSVHPTGVGIEVSAEGNISISDADRVSEKLPENESKRSVIAKALDVVMQNNEPIVSNSANGSLDVANECASENIPPSPKPAPSISVATTTTEKECIEPQGKPSLISGADVITTGSKKTVSMESSRRSNVTVMSPITMCFERMLGAGTYHLAIV